MSDLISRQAAIASAISGLTREIEGERWIRVAEVRESLLDISPEEPEQKTGKWIKPTGMMPPEYHGHYECSECGAWAMCTYHKSKVRLTRYCPGCGIKMENADV